MSHHHDYAAFLAAKKPTTVASGIEATALNADLFDYQAACVDFTLRQGRAGLYLDTGLGKTFCQLEWADKALHASNGRALILTPLAVGRQMETEAQERGYDARVIRSQAEARAGINICNYERLDRIDPDSFGVVSLDEASILKNLFGATTQALIATFSRHRFKLAATATPAPNDHMELGQQAEFLGVMTAKEMLARYFINDASTASQQWRLKRHAVEAFWEWMAGWSRMAQSPEDLGFDGSRFRLPPLEIVRHRADFGELRRPADGSLFALDVSATAMHDLKRQTAASRADKAAEVVAAEDSSCVVWVDTDYEADQIVKRLPHAIEVRGSMSIERKETNLTAFARGGGSHHHHQAQHRRHGVQLAALRAHGVRGPQLLLRSLVPGGKALLAIRTAAGGEGPYHRRRERGSDRPGDRSQGRGSRCHEEGHGNRHAPRQHAHHRADGRISTGLRGEAAGMARIRCLADRHGQAFAAYHGDCVDVMRQLPADSVDFSVYSPPFGQLFVYSSSIADMGNSTDEQFDQHYGFMVREKFRVTKPGRLTAVHCSDLPRTKWKDGVIGLKDFSGGIIKAHEQAGWVLHARKTIWKCPVVEMTRTKHIGLLYKQLQKDSSKSRGGLADYLLVFVKPGVNAEPIRHTPEKFPLAQWQEWASPVWMTIDQTRVLDIRKARGSKDERHICPLQLDVIERALVLWSNPGDVVLSPFMGVGSEGDGALRFKRRFLGIELKEEYFTIGCANLQAVEANPDSLLEGLEPAETGT